ncbi:MAG: uracil-DNA glycosylase family protein [Planctomycetota bacterium]
MDPELLRSLRLALDAERAFGVEDLPLAGPKRAEARDAAAVEAPASIEARPKERPGSTAVPGAERAAAPRPVERAPLAPAGPDLDEDPGKRLAALAARIDSCRACSLCESRRRTVPGQGSARARLLFVGEAPGEQEDAEGLAFVGRAGQLLTKMIGAMGLSRDEVFIANVLKCRPPQNRDPAPEEVQSCFHFLEEQIATIRPRVICTLGGHAANNLLERDDPMHRLRGRIFDYRGAQLVPTYHPSFLLRKPEMKRRAWEDLQVVMKLLG